MVDTSNNNNNDNDNDNVRLSFIDKLKIMIQISTAVADLHSKHIVHVDLDLCQFVLINGIYKLNDFHLANILKQEKQKQKEKTQEQQKQLCYVKPNYSTLWWFLRPPEEIPGSNNNNKDIAVASLDNKKSDVYMLGNCMYSILTSWYLWEHTPLHQKFSLMHNALRKGLRPPFVIKNNTNTNNNNNNNNTHTNSKNNTNDTKNNNTTTTTTRTTSKNNITEIANIIINNHYLSFNNNNSHNYFYNDNNNDNNNDDDITAVTAMINSIVMSWTHNVTNRPTARYISNYLLNEYKKIIESEQLQHVTTDAYNDNKAKNTSNTKSKTKTKTTTTTTVGRKRKRRQQQQQQEGDEIIHVNILPDPNNFVYESDDYLNPLGVDY